MYYVQNPVGMQWRSMQLSQLQQIGQPQLIPVLRPRLWLEVSLDKNKGLALDSIIPLWGAKTVLPTYNFHT